MRPHQPLAALVAHDWGGAVAWSVANAHPERLRQLVVINSPHPGPFLKALQSDPLQQAASAYMGFLVQPDAATPLAAHGFAQLLVFCVATTLNWAARTAWRPKPHHGSRLKWKNATAMSGAKVWTGA